MARIPRPVVKAIEPGSVAEAAGIGPGDRLTEINGHLIRDFLDYQFHTTEAELVLTIQKPTGEIIKTRVEKDPDADLGIDFGGQATFDGVYVCHNKCLFCFVHQQPRGMRPTLNLMDDDYRLSFLHGNFVTLVGLDPAHWQRILEQRLSPLYISVHATDDDLRELVMGTPEARGILERLRELAAGGISFHTQVVSCPGLNDGPALDRTIADLTAFGPEILLSLSVVPVGLTRHRDGLHPLRTYNGAEAVAMLEQLEGWQRRLEPEWGFPVVYASDEWYILAGREVPPAEFYGSYDQLENGVGMVRLFLEELQGLEPRIPATLAAPRRVTVLTGRLGGPFLQRAVDRLNQIQGMQARLVVADNEFYGRTVTCAGLLTGRDMLMNLAMEPDLGDLVLLPAVALRDGDGRTLDNLTTDMMSEKLGGVPVSTAGSPLELFDQATAGGLKPVRTRRTRLRFTPGAAEPGYYGVDGPRARFKTR